MARGNFGERLKRERELREVSPNEVVVATRISLRFLEALENEDWDKLPGGIFNRGFVRAIARYLGLDEEHLLAEYDLARGDQVPEPAPSPENRIPSPPKWIIVALTLGVLAAIAALVMAGVYGWRRYSAHRRNTPSAALTMPAGSLPHVNAATQGGLLLDSEISAPYENRHFSA
jgi:cytoskeletal protein RodZ